MIVWPRARAQEAPSLLHLGLTFTEGFREFTESPLDLMPSAMDADGVQAILQGIAVWTCMRLHPMLCDCAHLTA